MIYRTWSNSKVFSCCFTSKSSNYKVTVSEGLQLCSSSIDVFCWEWLLSLIDCIRAFLALSGVYIESGRLMFPINNSSLSTYCSILWFDVSKMSPFYDDFSELSYLFVSKMVFWTKSLWKLRLFPSYNIYISFLFLSTVTWFDLLKL